MNKRIPRSKLKSGVDADSVYLRVINVFLIIFLVFIVVFPIYVVANVSFKTSSEYATTGLLAFPENIHLGNYKYVLTFQDSQLITGFMNTLILISVSVTGSVLLGTMTAYILGRFNFKLKSVILALFILVILIPKETTHVATFNIIKSLGLFNTRAAGMILYMSTDIIQIMVFLQFITKIPISIDESARMNGASYFRVYYQMILPLMAPAILTVIIIKTVWIYNDLFVPYIYMPAKSLRTVTTALMALGQQGGAGRLTEWTTMSAAIIVAFIPTVILYAVFQKQIIAGVAEGSTKQ